MSLSDKIAAVVTAIGAELKTKVNADEIWRGTRAQYDELGTKDADTIYFVKES